MVPVGDEKRAPGAAARRDDGPGSNSPVDCCTREWRIPRAPLRGARLNGAAFFSIEAGADRVVRPYGEICAVGV